jgi:hypothetical protein
MYVSGARERANDGYGAEHVALAMRAGYLQLSWRIGNTGQYDDRAPADVREQREASAVTTGADHRLDDRRSLGRVAADDEDPKFQ